MRVILERLRRDPGLAFVSLALFAAVVVYAPTLGRGLVNYDDHWLIADNWILQDASWESLRTIAFDLHSPRRFVLTPEYLPARDLSIMVDFAIWGSWFPGFHLTNLVIYLAAIWLWFAALQAFGIERQIAGLAVLIWALHPSHAESVAWLTERKGLLAVMFAGACTLGYARFRAGRDARWLALAVLAAVCAVWSKAHGAFAVAAIVSLELLLPGRQSWRRSSIGLTAIAIVSALAFVPVMMLVRESSIVGNTLPAPASRLEMVLGVHGFYVRSAAMTIRNAVSYPLSTSGPSTLDLVLGVACLIAVLAVALVPRRRRWAPPTGLRAGAWIWLIGWLPVSHLILPLQMVYIADRYMLFPSLGICLMAAVGLMRIGRSSAKRALIATIIIAAALRTMDAQGSWRNSGALWERAVASNPADGNAWAMYVEAIVGGLVEGGDRQLAERVLAEGLRHASSPRLLHRQALMIVDADHTRAVELMRASAQGGEPIAMSNLALLLLADRAYDEALLWARAGATARPTAHAKRTLGKVALAMGRHDEALEAFRHAYAIEPKIPNRFNLGLVLVELQRFEEARPHIEACADDPALGQRARAMLAKFPR